MFISKPEEATVGERALNVYTKCVYKNDLGHTPEDLHNEL